MIPRNAAAILLFLVAGSAEGEPRISPIEQEACRLQLAHQEFPLACLRGIQVRGEVMQEKARRDLDRACLQARNIGKFSVRQIHRTLRHLPVTKLCRRILEEARRKIEYQSTESLF